MVPLQPHSYVEYVVHVVSERNILVWKRFMWIVSAVFPKFSSKKMSRIKKNSDTHENTSSVKSPRLYEEPFLFLFWTNMLISVHYLQMHLTS